MRRLLLTIGLLCALGTSIAAAQPQAMLSPHAGAPDSGPADDSEAADFEADDLFAWFAEEGEATPGEGAPGRAPHRGPALHRGPHGPMGPGGARRGPRLYGRAFAHLDLTEAQREQMRELHHTHRRNAIQRRAELELARLDLHELLRATQPQRGAIDAQIDKLARLQAEQHKARVHTMLAARALLTPAQQQQWRESRSQRPGRDQRSPARPGVRRRDGTLDRSGTSDS